MQGDIKNVAAPFKPGGKPAQLEVMFQQKHRVTGTGKPVSAG